MKPRPPWRYFPADKDNGYSPWIGTLVEGKPDDGNPDHYIEVCTMADNEEVRGENDRDGCLMRAAPDLLAACKELLVAFHGCPANPANVRDPVEQKAVEQKAVEQAMAAITKAEGGVQ